MYTKGACLTWVWGKFKDSVSIPGTPASRSVNQGTPGRANLHCCHGALFSCILGPLYFVCVWGGLLMFSFSLVLVSLFLFLISSSSLHMRGLRALAVRWDAQPSWSFLTLVTITLAVQKWFHVYVLRFIGHSQLLGSGSQFKKVFPFWSLKFSHFKKNGFKLLSLTLKYLSHLRFMLLDGAMYKHS